LYTDLPGNLVPTSIVLSRTQVKRRKNMISTLVDWASLSLQLCKRNEHTIGHCLTSTTCYFGLVFCCCGCAPFISHIFLRDTSISTTLVFSILHENCKTV